MLGEILPRFVFAARLAGEDRAGSFLLIMLFDDFGGGDIDIAFAA